MDNIKKHTLLIIDDEESEIMSLTTMLQDDYILHAATNGADAIALAAKHTPDIIILDALMPDTDGLSVITELKKAKATSQIPVLFTTTLNSVHNIEQGIALGAADYVIKPFSEAMLKLRIQNRLTIIQQLQTIEHLSMVDMLTDLPNRKSFEERLDSEWRRSMRDLLPLSIMMIDVDSFKNYNDIFGHRQGDAALQAVAQLFKTVLKRTGDFAARWGGEEFAILTANTDARDALRLAEKIRKSIELMEIPSPESFGEEDTKITVSIGVNTWDHETEMNKTGFISGASRALFAAKHDGRNRVRSYQNASMAGSAGKKKLVFIVDDSPSILMSAEEMLADSYRIVTLNSAEKMFQAFEKFTQPDMILLDTDMQEATGFEIISQLKSNSRFAEIPIMLMTGSVGEHSETDQNGGIELGAVDFITKPLSKTALLNRLKHHLQIDEIIRERTARLSERKHHLLEYRERQTLLQNGLVFTLASFVENHDLYTAGHIDRICVYMRLMIKAMRAKGVYIGEMSDWDLDLVVSAASMHDIGKIAVPDNILNKPGKLTEEEFDIVKIHPEQSKFVFRVITQRTGDAEILRYAGVIAATHHEKWDGTGYPAGQAGEAIPLLGRIMAIVDVYDALVSERSYKKPLPHAEAVSIIASQAGKHFDPEIVKVFSEIQEKLEASREKLMQ